MSHFCIVSYHKYFFYIFSLFNCLIDLQMWKFDGRIENEKAIEKEEIELRYYVEKCNKIGESYFIFIYL